MKIDEKRKELFLAALQESKGTVTIAARAAGVSRSGAYKARDADPDFRTKWDETIDGFVDLAEAELYRRAVEGTLKPVFFRGEECGTIREFSDAALIFYLKSRRPGVYRERLQVQADVSAKIEGSDSRESLFARMTAIAERLQDHTARDADRIDFEGSGFDDHESD